MKGSEGLTGSRRNNNVPQMEQSLYDTLHGNWSVNRVIEDRYRESDDRTGVFLGNAVFVGPPQHMTYKEVGTLTFGGAILQAERQYIWHCHANHATVLHKDGTPFHELTVQNNAASADHLCGEDHYNGAYAFLSDAEWRVTWTVSGPRKDYTSVTTYKRALTDLQ